MYSSSLSLTSALEGGLVVNVTPRPLYPQENDPLPIIYEGWNFNSGNYLFTTDTK